MATRNIVPRANNEGSLGTAAKQWNKIYAIGNGNGMVFDAGSTSASAFKLTAGTVQSAATAGSYEFDGVCFYTTPVASARGVSPSTMFAIVEAGDFNLATTSGVQAAFPTTKDVWTLAASTTYFFEGFYMITHSTTTCTCALAFLDSSAVTSIAYWCEAAILAANATSTSSNHTFVTQTASTVVTATSTVGWGIQFAGLIRTNAATTITPQVNWSANTTAPVMKANSYIRFTPLGTNTTNTCGNVA